MATHVPAEHCMPLGLVGHAAPDVQDPVASHVSGCVSSAHDFSPELHATHTPSRHAGTDPEQIEPFASQTPPMHVCG